MYDLGVKTYTPLIDMEKVTRDKIFPASRFEYNKDSDTYICPNGCKLKYSSVNASHRKKIYWSCQKDCSICSLRGNCIGGATIKARSLEISFFKEELDFQRSNYGTSRYFEVQRKRRVYCEGNFALQKDNHNLRRTRKRGNAKVTEHCLFSAMALNLKRLVKHLKGNYGILAPFLYIRLVFNITKRVWYLPNPFCFFGAFVNTPEWAAFFYYLPGLASSNNICLTGIL